MVSMPPTSIFSQQKHQEPPAYSSQERQPSLQLSELESHMTRNPLYTLAVTFLGQRFEVDLGANVQDPLNLLIRTILTKIGSSNPPLKTMLQQSALKLLLLLFALQERIPSTSFSDDEINKFIQRHKDLLTTIFEFECKISDRTTFIKALHSRIPSFEKNGERKKKGKRPPPLAAILTMELRGFLCELYVAAIATSTENMAAVASPYIEDLQEGYDLVVLFRYPEDRKGNPIHGLHPLAFLQGPLQIFPESPDRQSIINELVSELSKRTTGMARIDIKSRLEETTRLLPPNRKGISVLIIGKKTNAEECPLDPDFFLELSSQIHPNCNNYNELFTQLQQHLERCQQWLCQGLTQLTPGVRQISAKKRPHI